MEVSSQFEKLLSMEANDLKALGTEYFIVMPGAYQKEAIEVNHELIRRVLPKGTSFHHLT